MIMYMLLHVAIAIVGVVVLIRLMLRPPQSVNPNKIRVSDKVLFYRGAITTVGIVMNIDRDSGKAFVRGVLNKDIHIINLTQIVEIL